MIRQKRQLNVYVVGYPTDTLRNHARSMRRGLFARSLCRMLGGKGEGALTRFANISPRFSSGEYRSVENVVAVGVLADGTSRAAEHLGTSTVSRNLVRDRNVLIHHTRAILSARHRNVASAPMSYPRSF